MKDDFDYNSVPGNYIHCLYTDCPFSTDCLRFQVGMKAGKNIPVFSVVNPAYVDNKEEKCPYFQPDKLTRFAFGITCLYDTLPHAKAKIIREILFNHFQRNTYYRIQNKERYIKPKEEMFIRNTFKAQGIQEEPVFDEYVYKYDW